MINMASEGRTLTRLSLLKQLFSTGTCDCNLNCTLGKVKFRAGFRFEKYTGFFFFLSLSNFHSYYFAFLADSEDSGVSALVSVRSNYTSVRKKVISTDTVTSLALFPPYCCVPSESPVVRETSSQFLLAIQSSILFKKILSTSEAQLF